MSAVSGRFVRASLYRHVHGEPVKPEHEFVDIRAVQTGEGNLVAANEKFFAYAGAGSGGPVVIHRLDKPQRMPVSVPVLSVHKDPVLDFEFSPFYNHVIATAGEDLAIRVSSIPEEGLTGNQTNFVSELNGHDRKIQVLHWHPTCEHIIGSASTDNTLRVWDLTKNAQLVAYTDFQDAPLSFDWNPEGSLITATSRDLQIRLFDPRQVKSAMKAPSFPGSKSSKAVFQGSKGKVIAVGANKQSMRQYSVWDIKKFNTPLTTVDIDQAASVLVPYFNPDNSILYLAGKGDANIRYYEVVDTEPYLHYLDEFRDNAPQKGIAWLPRRAMKTWKCEIDVALRLMSSKITPVSFQVPRKSEAFQKDLYPETNAFEPILSVEEFLSGKSKPPKMMSMNPVDRGITVPNPRESVSGRLSPMQAVPNTRTPSPSPPSTTNTSSSSTWPAAAFAAASNSSSSGSSLPPPSPASRGGNEKPKSYEQLQQELAIANAKIAELEAEVRRLKALRAAKLAQTQTAAPPTPLSPSSSSSPAVRSPDQSPSSSKTTLSSLPPKPHTSAATPSKSAPANSNTPLQSPAQSAAVIAAVNSAPATVAAVPVNKPAPELDTTTATSLVSSAASALTPAASASASVPSPTIASKSSSSSSFSFPISLPYPLICLSLVILTVSYFWFGRRASNT